MSTANIKTVFNVHRFTTLLGHLIFNVAASLRNLFMAQVGGLNTQHDVNMKHTTASRAPNL